jgi:hypothetical protein
MKNYYTIHEIDKYNACAYTPPHDETNPVPSSKNVLIWDQIQMFPCVLQKDVSNKNIDLVFNKNIDLECFYMDIDGTNGRFLSYNGSTLYLQTIVISERGSYTDTISWKLKDPGSGGTEYLFITQNSTPRYFLSAQNKSYPSLSTTTKDSWSILSGPYENKFAITHDIDFDNIEYMIWKDDKLQLIRANPSYIPNEAYQWNNSAI